MTEDAAFRAAAFSAARYAGLPLPEFPRLAPWLVTIGLGDGRLQFRSAESSHTLIHPLLVGAYQKVEKLLDGYHAQADIVSFGDPEFEPTTIAFLLKLLHGKGLLQHGGDAVVDKCEDEIWNRQVRFLSHFVPNPVRAQSELAAARVGVIGTRGLRQAIVTALGSIGVDRVTELDEPSSWPTDGEVDGLDLIVAGEVAPGFALFDAVNRACLETRTRWLRVVISGTSAQLGPTFLPYETACHTCLDLRRQTHETELGGYLKYRAMTRDVAGVRDDGTALLSSTVCSQAAAETMRILIAHAAPVTFGRYYEFSARSPVVTPHDVLKVPRCPSCGSARYTEAWDRSDLPAVRG